MVNKFLNWLGTIPPRYRKWRYKHSYEKAVKHANHFRNTSGYKCLVLFVDDVHGYKAFTKHSLKILCQSKYFKKGTTVQMLESMAVYTTN